MSPIYLHNNKILLRDGKIATHEDCCCWERWLRSQMRIGSRPDVVEQVWLVAAGEPQAAPYVSQQIPQTSRNADWMPNELGASTDPVVYPFTSATQSFYIIYDKAARTIRFKLSNADTSGRNPPPASPESVAVVPANKLTSETESYPLDVFVGAIGRSLNGNTIVSISAKIKLFDCSLQVVGEPNVQIPDTEVSWSRGANWVPGTIPPPGQNFTRKLSGHKLGKGFTITGSATMSWEGIRPLGSHIQGWFALYDYTRDYII